MQIVESNQNNRSLFSVIDDNNLLYTTLKMSDAEEFIENYISPNFWPEPPDRGIE